MSKILRASILAMTLVSASVSSNASASFATDMGFAVVLYHQLNISRSYPDGTMCKPDGGGAHGMGG